MREEARTSQYPAPRLRTSAVDRSMSVKRKVSSCSDMPRSIQHPARVTRRPARDVRCGYPYPSWGRRVLVSDGRGAGRGLGLAAYAPAENTNQGVCVTVRRSSLRIGDDSHDASRRNDALEEGTPEPLRQRRSGQSGRPDSNRRPPAPKAGALPGCATSRSSGSVYGRERRPAVASTSLVLKHPEK